MNLAKRLFLFGCAFFLFSLTTIATTTAYAANHDKANNNGTVGQQIGVKSPATDLWRAVRQRDQDNTENLTGKSQVKGPNSGTLINVGGQEWREWRVSKLIPYSMYAIGGMLILIALFRLIRGKIKIKAGRSGIKINRFTNLQRYIHWTVAILFVILGITGVIMTLGRYGLLPLIGKEAFGFIAYYGKMLHNYLGPVFSVMLIVMLFAFIKGNFLNWVDFKWFLKGGGLFGGHASAGRYNGGEKAWYWIIATVGIVVVASGLILNFPQFVTILDLSSEQFQKAQFLHAVGSIGLFVVSFGHIYMGTIAMEGAFEAMKTGDCDTNWAKEHHDLWYEDLKNQGLINTTGGGSASNATATSAAVMSSGGISTAGKIQRNTDSSVTEIESGASLSTELDSSSSKDKLHSTVSVSGSKPDDLKKIEGIGPKIEELLRDAGLASFAAIMNSNREEIKAILNAAGPRYKMHEPKTWPEQAALADKGAWEELKDLQDRLNGDH